MKNRFVWLDEYAGVLNEIRNKLKQLYVVEEATYRYAIIRLFARTTLSMCEIYTLMSNGYPEGAFALSRQIYEAIVLMDYLTIHKNDEAMMERYFDDIEITKIKIRKEIEQYTQDDIRFPAADELKEYVEKHLDFYDERKGFTDYWWVRKNGRFSDIVKETKFPKYYMYKEASSVIHMSLFNSVTYVGEEQNGILIGETYDGVDRAGWYSMLCYCEAMDLLGKACNIDLSALISRGREVEINIKKSLL